MPPAFSQERTARAEVAAYADCTESQLMAMFGWTDPKMSAHDIAQANRERSLHSIWASPWTTAWQRGR